MSLMPNSSGVFPNSVQGFNTAIANQSAPRLNAFGNYGTDPLTGATITDKSSAQNALANFANPNSLQSRALSSMQPTMIPGGGGGGGRMGPRQDRRKIMRLGPRTTSEFTAENGSLSAPRESTLDTAYNSGNLTSGFMPKATGNQGNPLVPNADPLPGGGYNVDLAQFDQPQDPTRPKMMAKGGTMKIHKGPYLVGEEGPELIMPRGNGEGFVLPADVTAQVLPTMRDVTPKKSGGKMAYTPRAQGGIMTLNTPNATFSGGTTPYGPVYGMRQTESQMGSPQPMTMEEAGLAMQPDQRMIVDNGYQVDLPALTAPGNQTIPLQPDVVTGPFASPAMPADTTGLQPFIQNQISRLSMAGAAPVSRYPGQTFQDTAPGASAAPVSFEELRDRVALRGMMYGDDIRDRNARNQTQLDLAARANRAPLGTPPAPVQTIPGMPTMRPSTQRAIDRNLERFYSTPQGALLAAEQAQQSVEGNIVDTAMLPVGNEGFVPVVRDAAGRQRMAGSFIPNARNTQAQNLTPAQAKELGLVPIQSEGGRITYGQPSTPPKETDFELADIIGPMIQDPVTKAMVPGPKQTVRVNKRTGEYEPLRATGATPATAAATPTASSGPPQIRNTDDYNALPKGTRYLTPTGILKVKNS